MQIDVKLEGLRADISYSLRQKHYTDAVRALVTALDQATIDLEDGDGKTLADKIGMSEFRNQFVQNTDEYSIKRAPERMEKKLKRLTQERMIESMALKQGDLVSE